jgi:hypothetical protein
LNGKYKSKVKALILLGFTDSYGGQLDYLKKNGKRNEDVLKEAKELVKQGKPHHLLSDLYINWGELPQSAQSYISFMSDDSALSNILPLGQSKEFTNFKKIRMPILGIVGDTEECTVIPPKLAVEKLNQENHNADCYLINNCSHGYQGKEKELVKIVRRFLEKIV